MHMRNNGTIICGMCGLMLLLGACANQQVNPKETMQVLIVNMHNNSYDFKGELHAQVGEETLEDLLVLDGFYVPNEGYRLHADVNLPGFETGSDVLSVDDNLYYKLPSSRQWKPATDQDLRMLGITYKDSPSEMFRGMKEAVLSVEQTGENNVFRVTLDRKKYENREGQERLRLPRVDIENGHHQLELSENPVADVEVDLSNNVIRSFTLNYVLEPSLADTSEQSVNVTYEMHMEHFNENQLLPDL